MGHRASECHLCGASWSRASEPRDNVIRGRRRAEGKQANPKSEGIDRVEYKIKWRDLIWKIWEFDPP